MNSLSAIVNGPYLLAPTATGLTITWETNIPVSAKLLYGVQESFSNEMTVPCQQGAHWKDSPAGIAMYRATLTNLLPATSYSYKIELESGESRIGSFKTLQENPGEIRIVTLSDSHLFTTCEDFTRAAIEYQPDFIVHSGDISMGTGFQKEQYNNNWFQKGANFLKHIPVVYIYGNHDEGPYFDDMLLKPQKDTYHTDRTGRNFSFTYGNTHITMLNSNPWGFYEMNAIGSNYPVGEVTQSIIDDTITWLHDDLQSVAAQNSTWRIVVLHHPYTDEFTNKRIVSVVEEHNVDLVVAGHLHYYIKNISVNPDVGAKTVYITQGSPHDPGCTIDYGTEGERILPDFPEIVATGTTNYGSICISGEKLVFKTYGFTATHESKLVDEVILVKQEPQVVFTDIAIRNSADEQSNTVLIEGTASNQGQGLAAVTLAIRDNDKVTVQNLFGVSGKERVVVLNPGEEKRVQTGYNLTGAGKHTISVGGVTKTIEVKRLEPFFLENCKVKVGQGPHSDCVFVSAVVTNNHNTVTMAEIDLYIDDNRADCKKLELLPYEKRVIQFVYQFCRGGVYQLRVAHLEPREVKIQGTLKGCPVIRDKSGRGNHAWLRGTPRIASGKDGVTVTLADYGDYIEIPDSENLRVTDGYSGVVWANITRLATEEEMGHNPLLLKGASIGWGATYLLRMAVERSGGLKWGTCHGSNEYTWQGGKIKQGDWAQYTSAFDKQTGGASYVDCHQVAQIAGIAESEVLRNWEGFPLFIGYSFIGHVIPEIGRPKYFTHLPAQIGQVRFYKAKLSQEELEYIYEHPEATGSHEQDLLVWLDFRDIETRGIHKTEWRQPVDFKPAYKAEKRRWSFNVLTAKATIPGSASIQAMVEVSDDGETIKGIKRVCLQNGTQTIDINGLPQAQYIRIVSEFAAAITPDATDIPELHEYSIKATAEYAMAEFGWATRVDWERGHYEGAVGFEPLDRLTIFDEFSDVIHG